MPNLSTLKTLTTSRNFWYIIIALAAFISIAIYVYSNYIAPTIQPAYVPNKEFVKEKASQSQIHLFYVDWCPHSKLAKEEWLKVKEKFNKKVVNGTVLDFIEINGEEEDGQIETISERLAASNRTEPRTQAKRERGRETNGKDSDDVFVRRVVDERRSRR